MAIKKLDCRGFALIELMIVIGIVGLLSAVGVPNYLKYKEKALIISAVSEIRIITEMIDLHEAETYKLPDSLSELRFDNSDPWGNPYQYLNIKDAETQNKGKTEPGEKTGPKDKMRKDHFMVPVNSDYDLYSMGRDGKSVAPFTAKASRDDIVRANNGGFVGLAADF